jgi:hypothetical protein
MSLLRRLAEPFGRFSEVLRNTLAFVIHQPEHTLCIRISLLRRLTVPFGSFCEVLRYTLAIVIHHPKIVLCIHMSLLRRLAEPFGSGYVVSIQKGLRSFFKSLIRSVSKGHTEK